MRKQARKPLRMRVKFLPYQEKAIVEEITIKARSKYPLFCTMKIRGKEYILAGVEKLVISKLED
jgi:hypothetical protein